MMQHAPRVYDIKTVTAEWKILSVAPLQHRVEAALRQALCCKLNGPLTKINAAKYFWPRSRPKSMIGTHTNPNLENVSFLALVELGKVENVWLKQVPLTSLLIEIKGAGKGNRVHLSTTLCIPIRVNFALQ